MKADNPRQAFRTDLLRFLMSPAISNGDGTLHSWVNPDHPGFIYPEAMGLHLRLFSVLAARTGDPALRAWADQVLAGIGAVTPSSGGVGMGGFEFQFDTCMVVGGLFAYKHELGGTVDPGLMERTSRFVLENAEARRVLVDGEGRVPDQVIRWSRMFGAHMLKTVIALDCLHRETGNGRYGELAMQTADQVIESCLRDGAFRVGPGQESVYCHAHCYALEGLLYLRAMGVRDESGILRDGAERLAGWQNDDGSLSNWYEDGSRETTRVGDATSQTVRVWMAVDRERYADNIDRAVSFLKSLRSPLSGLYYSTGSRDVNIITSVFAAQAVDWLEAGPQPEWLV